MWTAETRNADGLPERDPGSVSYSAAVESAASRPTDPLPSPFAQRAYREARRRGFDTAARRVVIGDGAEWIWNLSAEQFPGAIEIVDIYHAKGHLCDVAKAIYGAGTDLAVRWGKDRQDELDPGRFDAILTALRAHRETCEEARKCIDYLTRNRPRMRYPEFRAWGLCVSSGVVEAGCKLAIGARLKRAGMHWTVAGANAIIALRCCKLSGRFGQEARGRPIYGRIENEDDGGGGEPGPRLKIGAVRTRRLTVSEGTDRPSGRVYGNPLRDTRDDAPAVPIGAAVIARTDVPDARGWRVYRVAPTGAVIYDGWIEHDPANAELVVAELRAAAAKSRAAALRRAVERQPGHASEEAITRWLAGQETERPSAPAKPRSRAARRRWRRALAQKGGRA